MMQSTALAFFGWGELFVIAALVVLLFGATRLPQIGRGLGEGIREFKNALGGGSKEDDERRRLNDGEDSKDRS